MDHWSRRYYLAHSNQVADEPTAGILKFPDRTTKLRIDKEDRPRTRPWQEVEGANEVDRYVLPTEAFRPQTIRLTKEESLSHTEKRLTASRGRLAHLGRRIEIQQMEMNRVRRLQLASRTPVPTPVLRRTDSANSICEARDNLNFIRALLNRVTASIGAVSPNDDVTKDSQSLCEPLILKID
jgi:hypothetical protein